MLLKTNTGSQVYQLLAAVSEQYATQQQNQLLSPSLYFNLLRVACWPWHIPVTVAQAVHWHRSIELHKLP